MLGVSRNMDWIIFEANSDTIMLAKQISHAPWLTNKVKIVRPHNLQHGTVTNGGSVYVVENSKVICYVKQGMPDYKRFNPVVSGMMINTDNVTKGRLHMQKITGILPANDSDHSAITHSEDGTVRLWDARYKVGHNMYSRWNITAPAIKKDAPMPTAVSSHRDSVIVGYTNGQIMFVKDPEKKPTGTPFKDSDEAIESVAFSPYGNWFGWVTANCVKIGENNTATASIPSFWNHICGSGWMNSLYYVAGEDHHGKGVIRFFRAPTANSVTLKEELKLTFGHHKPTKVCNDGMQFIAMLQEKGTKDKTDYYLYAFGITKIIK